MNGSGFYSLNTQEPLLLLYAMNRVTSKNFELLKELHESYTYPIGGWTWFESEAEARIFFELPPLPPLTEQPTGE
jgi:hypothetical protein